MGAEGVPGVPEGGELLKAEGPLLIGVLVEGQVAFHGRDHDLGQKEAPLVKD